MKPQEKQESGSAEKQLTRHPYRASAGDASAIRGVPGHTAVGLPRLCAQAGGGVQDAAQPPAAGEPGLMTVQSMACHAPGICGFVFRQKG